MMAINAFFGGNNYEFLNWDSLKDDLDMGYSGVFVEMDDDNKEILKDVSRLFLPF